MKHKRCQRCQHRKPIQTFAVKTGGKTKVAKRCRKCRGGSTVTIQKKGKRIYSAAEKAAMRAGRLAGRATLNQRNFLQSHGYDRGKVAGWTAHRASVEIGKIIQLEADAMCEALEADNHRQKKELDDGWDDAILHK